MLMAGFEPGSSGIGSDRSANCATTTARRRRQPVAFSQNDKPLDNY